MTQHLHTLAVDDPAHLESQAQHQAIDALESGQVIYFPHYFYKLQAKEQMLLSEAVLSPKHKNISYNYLSQRLAGSATHHQSPELHAVMQQFMHGFAEFAKQLVVNSLPGYCDALQWGRTSYRPAEIKGRKSSKRKDDTRLHVDAFPSTPVNGLRILRVFCNINPHGKPRVWHLGEPFPQVLAQFAPKIPKHRPTLSRILKWLKATKTLRTPYDHYMLHLHDKMKLDESYQGSVTKTRVDFPPKTTWLVFTDQTSHAALSGQFLLEQTFYLPVQAMANPEFSPLKQWEDEKAFSNYA